MCVCALPYVAAQKQISDKQADIKCLEESTSRCDVLAKELHQRLRRARDNYERYSLRFNMNRVCWYSVVVNLEKKAAIKGNNTVSY